MSTEEEREALIWELRNVGWRDSTEIDQLRTNIERELAQATLEEVCFGCKQHLHYEAGRHGATFGACRANYLRRMFLLRSIILT